MSDYDEIGNISLTAGYFPCGNSVCILSPPLSLLDVSGVTRVNHDMNAESQQRLYKKKICDDRRKRNTPAAIVPTYTYSRTLALRRTCGNEVYSR